MLSPSRSWTRRSCQKCAVGAAVIGRLGDAALLGAAALGAVIFVASTGHEPEPDSGTAGSVAPARRPLSDGRVTVPR